MSRTIPGWDKMDPYEQKRMTPQDAHAVAKNEGDRMLKEEGEARYFAQRAFELCDKHLKLAACGPWIPASQPPPDGRIVLLHMVREEDNWFHSTGYHRDGKYTADTGSTAACVTHYAHINPPSNA